MCNYRTQGRCIFLFALGLTCSCFFPERFIINAIAIILIVLAIILMRF